MIVSPTRQSATVLMPAVMKPISPGPSASTATPFGVKTPTRSIACIAPVAIRRIFRPGFEHAVLDPHQGHDAEIGVVPAVDQQRLERRRGIARAAAAGGSPAPPAPRRY